MGTERIDSSSLRDFSTGLEIGISLRIGDNCSGINIFPCLALDFSCKRVVRLWVVEPASAVILMILVIGDLALGVVDLFELV